MFQRYLSPYAMAKLPHVCAAERYFIGPSTFSFISSRAAASSRVTCGGSLTYMTKFGSRTSYVSASTNISLFLNLTSTISGSVIL